MKEWKLALANDDSANIVVATTGSKRKAVGILYFARHMSDTDGTCSGRECQRGGDSQPLGSRDP